MSTHHNVKLTSAEIAILWTTYQNDTLSNCMFKYFLSIVDDPDIEPILQLARAHSKQHIEFMTQVFTEDKFPIPVGFSEKEDVYPNAARIYEDTFFLMFLRQMAKAYCKIFTFIYVRCISYTQKSKILT